MTKATIKKAAKAAGVDLSLIKITKIGGEYHGFKTGYGAWHYTLASMTAGERLAALNID